MSFEYLGQRAKQRRHALKLTLTHVAKALQMKYATLWQWEERLPQIPNCEKERLWEKALYVPRGWLRDTTIETPDPRLSPNWIDHVALGRRARERRNELGYSCKYVCSRIGLTMARLYLWEEQLPLTVRRKVEPRLEKVLMVPKGWLRNAAIPTPVPPGHILPVDPTQYDLTSYLPGSVAEEIRLIAILLAQGDARFRVVSFNLLNDHEKMRATLFANRYGVRGRDNVTLQSCGDLYGLTRERVRQIVEAMKTQALSTTFVTPKINLLMKQVDRTSITSVSKFESVHRALLGRRLSFNDTARFLMDILHVHLPPFPHD